MRRRYSKTRITAEDDDRNELTEVDSEKADRSMVGTVCEGMSERCQLFFTSGSSWTNDSQRGCLH